MYKIKSAAVIGAGTMGLGIAGQLANAGVPVVLLDVPAAGDNRNAVCERALERLLDERQPGLLHKDFVERITIGNIEDDLDKIATADWMVASSSCTPRVSGCASSIERRAASVRTFQSSSQ